MIDSDPDTAESGAEQQRNRSTPLCRAHGPPSEPGTLPAGRQLPAAGGDVRSDAGSAARTGGERTRPQMDLKPRRHS